MGKINLLDCTLRDGGYINNWRFGEEAIPDMIEKLEQTKVDVLEIGFLKNEPYQKDRTVFNSMEQVKALIPEKKPGIQYAVMCEVVNPLPLDMLAPADAESADIIRVIVWKTEHDKDGNEVDALEKGFAYCRGIIERGYKLCVQPARVSQYSDAEFVSMVKRFSELDPMAIYVVDSWGTENAEKLLHYMHLADDNMPAHIALGYHGHNNMMQALGVSQAMIQENFNRDIMIDASVYGIGRGAGNLNLELIAKYLNEEYGKGYLLDPMLDVYSDHIAAIYEKEKWGYSVPYFLTAKYNCNPAYAREMVKNDAIVFAEKILSELSAEERVMFSKQRFDEIVYYVKKKNVRFAIVIPTSNRVEIVKFWINIIGKEACQKGCDLIFYDSSSKKNREEITRYIGGVGLPNIRLEQYDEPVEGVLCNKVYAAAKWAVKANKYDYIWIIRDRSLPNLSTVLKHMDNAMNEEADFAVVYPHPIQPKFYGHCTYTDCAKLFSDWCGEMTSLGSIIFSASFLEKLTEEYQVDETNLGLWLPIALFHYIADVPFLAYFFSDNSFSYLPYSGSFWVRNSTLLWLFAERWNIMMDKMPRAYRDVVERVRHFEGWKIPPFSRQLILSARAAGDISLGRVLKCRDCLKRCAHEKIPMLFAVSLVPSRLISYYQRNQSTLPSRCIRAVARAIVSVYKFGQGILQSVKSPFIKKREMQCEWDLQYAPNSTNSMLGTKENESVLLYGDGELPEAPLISIIIPTNGRVNYFKDALDSVLNQTPVPFEWECIVVDNEPYSANANASQKYVEKTKSRRVTYYRNRSNIGADGNMNRGAALARGKWIAFLHDDDLLYPDFLQRIGLLIQGLSGRCVGLIFGQQNFVDYRDFEDDETGKLKFYWNAYYNMSREDKYQLLQVKNSYAATGENPFNVPSCGCTYLREAYMQFGGHNEKRFGLVDDAFLACAVAEGFGAYMCSTPFGDYRWGTGTTTRHIGEVMRDHYRLRDYMYSKHVWSRVFKKSLQMEHTRFSQEAFSTFDPMCAEQTSNELVQYVPNPIRRFLVRVLRKMAHLQQAKTKIDLSGVGGYK